jgi:RNA polymerase-binding protein DksA
VPTEEATMTSSTIEPPAAGPVISADLRARLVAGLEDQRRELLERASRFGRDIEQLQTHTATIGQGETDQATSETERAVAEVLEAGTRAALEDIESALARLDDGSYGVCTTCGIPIPVERLLVLPETRLCVACRARTPRVR